MAYKSRVTNKYMGSTFAGRVNAATTTETSDLINVLQKSVNPALSRIYNQNIANKKDEAVQEINQLLTTRNIDTVQKEILEGKHPNLNNKYVQKTVQYHTGKVQAIDAIKTIEENKSNYDFRETNLPAFYKQYLPSFADKEGSYALGFSAVFNKYKADEAIKDAKVRSDFAQTTKINEGVKLVLNEDIGNEWETINKGLDYDLPPEEGGGTIRKFYSNEEKNDIAIAAAESLYNTATTPEEIDRGLKILSANRGVGKNGMNLGSLINTKREDVDKLVKKLRDRKVTLIQQDRLNKDNIRKDEIREIFTTSNSKITEEKNGVSVERYRTYDEQLKLREKLQTYGDPTILAAFDAMVDKNRFVNTDPNVFTDITSQIFEGGYGSQSELMEDLISKNVSSENFGKALTYYNNYTSDLNNGIKPIYKTDFTYSSVTTDIINSIKGNFNVGMVGMEKPNSGEAIRNANAYLRKEIIDFHENYQLENDGKLPSRKEKDEFMQSLGDVMKTRFTPDNVQPQMQSFTSYEAEQKELETARQEKLKRYTEQGVTPIIQALNKQLELDEGLIQLPDINEDSRFKDFIPFNQPSLDEFKEQKIIPFISNYLQNALGNLQFTSENIAAMEQADFNELLRNLSEQFRGTSKTYQISPIDIQNAIKAITKGN
jgi:hypothetical protein